MPKKGKGKGVAEWMRKERAREKERIDLCVIKREVNDVADYASTRKGDKIYATRRRARQVYTVSSSKRSFKLLVSFFFCF